MQCEITHTFYFQITENEEMKLKLLLGLQNDQRQRAYGMFLGGDVI